MPLQGENVSFPHLSLSSELQTILSRVAKVMEKELALGEAVGRVTVFVFLPNRLLLIEQG